MSTLDIWGLFFQNSLANRWSLVHHRGCFSRSTPLDEVYFTLVLQYLHPVNQSSVKGSENYSLKNLTNFFQMGVVGVGIGGLHPRLPYK